MKKVLSLLAATMVASMAIADSGIELKYLPTAGDKNAAGQEFSKDDKVSVEAGEVLAAGTNFTVYNAYNTTYKAVGVMADTAYNTIKINDTEVDFKTMRIQGQDNPKDGVGAGNPGLSLQVPVQGACFRVNVKAEGMIVAFIKTTPNKNFFAYDQVKEVNSKVVGSAVEYRYAAMSVVKEGTYGNPNGLAQIYYKGDEYGEMLTNGNTPQSLYSTTDATNGIGMIAIEVDPEYGDYIIGTGGSKMMACAFAFIPKDEIATTKIVAVGSEGKDGTPHSDVTLFPFAENAVVQECGEKLNEYKITMIAPNEWIRPADTTDSDSTKWAYKCSCVVTEGDAAGKIYEMAVAQKISTTNPRPVDNKYTYTYKTKATSFNVSFLCGTKFTTKNMCSLTVKDVNAAESTFTVVYNADGKCTIKEVAEAYDNEKDGPFGETALQSLSAEKSSAIVYNILGQRVPTNTKGLVIINGKKVIRK